MKQQKMLLLLTGKMTSKALGDAADFFAYTVGNVIPSLATTIAGGGVGGLAAKYAAKRSVEKLIQRKARQEVW